MNIKEIAKNIHSMLQKEVEGAGFDFELKERKSQNEIWYFGFKVFNGIDLTRGIVSAYARPEHDVVFSVFDSEKKIEQKLRDRLSYYWEI